MRVVFIGCVEFSREALLTVLQVPEVNVVGVMTLSQSKFNSDFCDLQPTALANQISSLYFDKNSADAEAWLKELRPDLILCLGWSKLLPASFLSIPKLGGIGYHPAALPQNRGRHPVIWALALGLKQTASSYFFMKEDADSGDIVSQVPLAISEEDDAGSLFDKLLPIALKQLRDFLPQIAAGTLKAKPQDDSRANSWRKRSKADGIIHWQQSASGIYNLVRALARPYPGACFIYQENEYKVWRSRIEKNQNQFSNIEYGKILAIRNREILVKCGEDSVWLIDHELQNLPKVGEYLL
jgi:methionyl-tRNA formyltransferase